MHYTYLITNIENNMHYIGVRSCQDNDDSNYMGSSKYLADAIAYDGIEKFKKRILARWSTRALANAHEIWLHGYYDVKTNCHYYNKSNAIASGFTTYGNKDVIKKAKITRSTVKGQERLKAGAKLRQSTYYNDISWCKSRDYTHLKTISSQNWLDTIGKEQRRKQRATIKKNNVGKLRGEKNKETFNDPLWLDTIGKEKAIKISKLKRIRDEQNKTQCLHCKRYLDPANIKRWHGDKCKFKKMGV